MRPGILAFFLVCSLISGQPVRAGCPSFSGLIDRGAWGVADGQGRIIGGCNLDQSLVPASVIKLATALAALELLGPEYRFQTRFFTDQAHTLYIQGFGDPLLVSEEVLMILRELKDRGIGAINDIVIDASCFALEKPVPGRGRSANPYDAPIAAVSVNFNSVAIRVGRDHRVRSAERHTPTLPLMRELGRFRKEGRYRLNVCARGGDPARMSVRLCAELFRALQKKAGIPGQGTYRTGPVPPGARLVLVHRNSRRLLDVLDSMLKFSSNYIANLVYLRLGAYRYGYPATWAKADRAVRETLTSLLGRETMGAIVQEDGSGLSRANRVTARAMLRVLHLFRPHADLLRRRQGLPVKSGTMRNIYNYAGYLADGRPFVIILNQRANTRETVLARLRLGRFPVMQTGKRP